MATAHAPTELGSRIRERREAAGLSLLDLMMAVRNVLPRSMWVTDETLRRYETDWPEEKTKIFILAAIADALGCKLRDLAPTLVIEADRVLALLTRATAAYRKYAA